MLVLFKYLFEYYVNQLAIVIKGFYNRCIELFWSTIFTMAKGFKELSNVKKAPVKDDEPLLNNKHLAYDRNGNVINPIVRKEKNRQRTQYLALTVATLSILIGQVYVGANIRKLAESIDGMNSTPTLLQDYNTAGLTPPK